MNMKTLLPAALAVVLGGAAAFMVRNSMMKSKPGPASTTAPKMIPAVVATGDLIAGQELTNENLSMVTVAATTPPGDTIANPVELIGRVVSVPVRKGEPIHLTGLAPKGATGTLPSLIPAGMRAITLQVDETNSLSGMLLPGCHVDIYSTISAGKDSVNRQLVKNALVQAVGTRLTSARPEDGKEPPPYHTVTLILTPREAQLIDFASASNRLRFLLRPFSHSAEGVEDMQDARININDVLGLDEHPVAVAQMPPTTQPAEQKIVVVRTPKRDVTLILGTATTIQKVDANEPMPIQDADTDGLKGRIIDGSPEQHQD